MNIILILHDWARWLIMIFAIVTVWMAISGKISGRPYGKPANISSLLFMIFMDIQILLGFLLYFNNGWFDKLKHAGVYMKDANQRFFIIEHWLIMIIAWVLVHAGRSAVKRAGTDPVRYKRMLLYFGIALLLILIGIPWPFREALARPWIRWF